MTTTTVTDRSALAAALRDLKLSGMLATLDARLAQAHAGELGHLDFLQVLCQDEISRRATMALTRRLRRARFETPATLEGFDFAAAPKLPAAQIRDLAALRWLQSGESVILYGPVGVGKSHVAIPSERPTADEHRDRYQRWLFRTAPGGDQPFTVDHLPDHSGPHVPPKVHSPEHPAAALAAGNRAHQMTRLCALT